MKQFLSFFLYLVVTAPIAGGNKTLQPERITAGGESRWTGHIKMEEKTTISAQSWTAESIRTVQASFMNALPTLFRDDNTTDLDFTDDKGTGSHTFHGEETIGGRKCVTDCSSSGKPQLHQVVVDEIGRVYHIEVISPECQGTTCADDGNPAPYNSTVSVLALDEPLGTSRDILSGTKTETGDLPGGLGKFTRTISWHFVRTTEMDVELIVTPKKYDAWLPEPGTTFNNPGSVMDISLNLRGRNGTTTNKKAKSFELRLLNTSREPGITINFPINNSSDSADLQFIPQAGAIITDGENQSMIIMCNPGRQSADFKIGAYDGGGWTILNAEAILEDNSRAQGRLLVSNGEIDIRIPKREPNSKIAEAWLKLNGNPGEIEDKENSKGNTNNGDGLTAYEEYRGVISEGSFKRLDPKKKELGIKLKRSEAFLFTEGVKWLEDASDIKIIRFFETEIARNRRFNKNAKSGHDYDQYVLRVEKRNLPSGVIGTAYRSPDIPANTDPVVFDWDQIQTAYQNLTDSVKPALLKFTLSDYLASTIAHEIAHAINIWHHGGDLTHPIRVINDLSNSNRVFDRTGNSITRRPIILRSIGKETGTVESGDISCFLNYYPYYNWGYTVGIDGANIFNQTHLLPLGKKLCVSKNGTGPNATPLYFGDADATKGNCLSQIKLRD